MIRLFTIFLLLAACATNNDTQNQTITYKDKTYTLSKDHSITTKTYNLNYDIGSDLFTSSAEATDAADYIAKSAEIEMKKTCGRHKAVKTSGPNIVSSNDVKYTGKNSINSSSRGLGLLFFAVDDSIWFEYKCE